MSNDYNFYVKRRRPEEIYDDVRNYYTKEEISRYATSKSIMRIQEKITIRALELLELKNRKSLILDAGCGPGFTAIYLNGQGFKTITLDLIPEFLFFYDIKYLNPIVADMCYVPFKEKEFDAIISISAFQWIFREVHNKTMEHRLINLVKSFYSILKHKTKTVIQFYPKSKTIMDAIGELINKNTKFEGRYIIDNPKHPKKRKIFLVLEKNT